MVVVPTRRGARESDGFEPVEHLLASGKPNLLDLAGADGNR
jgi:hypothetical protein